MHVRTRRLCFAALASTLLFAWPCVAQLGTTPPAVGTMKIAKRDVTESETFVGRVQAVNRYSAVARVTAFLEKMVFSEGHDVRKGDLLYQLEQPPFEAEVESKKGTIANLQSQLKGADLSLARSTALLGSPAGLQSKVDQDRAQDGSLLGQIQSAQADLKTSQINLSYTTISSPIDGKVGRTAVTVGNLVSPDSGVLTTVVSQDPMYVLFTIPTRAMIDLRSRYADRGGLDAMRLKLVLPDGRTYGQTGRVNFTDNTIAATTDSYAVRGLFANPPIHATEAGHTARELIDGEYVTVILEDATPVSQVAIPRSAVLTDQRGDYVYVVGDDRTARRQDILLGRPIGTETTVQSGLAEGQTIVVDNLQRVRTGEQVAPMPAQADAVPRSAAR